MSGSEAQRLVAQYLLNNNTPGGASPQNISRALTAASINPGMIPGLSVGGPGEYSVGDPGTLGVRGGLQPGNVVSAPTSTPAPRAVASQPRAVAPPTPSAPQLSTSGGRVTPGAVGAPTRQGAGIDLAALTNPATYGGTPTPTSTPTAQPQRSGNGAAAAATPAPTTTEQPDPGEFPNVPRTMPPTVAQLGGGVGTPDARGRAIPFRPPTTPIELPQTYSQQAEPYIGAFARSPIVRTPLDWLQGFQQQYAAPPFSEQGTHERIHNAATGAIATGVGFAGGGPRGATLRTAEPPVVAPHPGGSIPGVSKPLGPFDEAALAAQKLPQEPAPEVEATIAQLRERNLRQKLENEYDKLRGVGGGSETGAPPAPRAAAPSTPRAAEQPTRPTRAAPGPQGSPTAEAESPTTSTATAPITLRPTSDTVPTSAIAGGGQDILYTGRNTNQPPIPPSAVAPVVDVPAPPVNLDQVLQQSSRASQTVPGGAAQETPTIVVRPGTATAEGVTPAAPSEPPIPVDIPPSGAKARAAIMYEHVFGRPPSDSQLALYMEWLASGGKPSGPVRP